MFLPGEMGKDLVLLLLKSKFELNLKRKKKFFCVFSSLFTICFGTFVITDLKTIFDNKVKNVTPNKCILLYYNI